MRTQSRIDILRSGILLLFHKLLCARFCPIKRIFIIAQSRKGFTGRSVVALIKQSDGLHVIICILGLFLAFFSVLVRNCLFKKRDGRLVVAFFHLLFALLVVECLLRGFLALGSIGKVAGLAIKLNRPTVVTTIKRVARLKICNARQPHGKNQYDNNQDAARDNRLAS